MLNNRIADEFAKRTPKSAERYQVARQVFPSGITHDARYLLPHPVFIDRAAGARKWDIDGNEYVDYFGGHGSLILGHSHPAVVEAVQAQAGRGTHFGAAHELELEWGQLVQSMVPSAERVRFTSSGTEATLLGLRVARAFTGKPRFVRFATHFHGWHDYVVMGGAVGAMDVPAGISADVAHSAVVCPPNDIEALRGILDSADDIGTVIIEPTGASFGHVPQSGEYLAQLRQLTRERGIVLIFDEVITGFRCAPGGAQEFYRVVPDMTTLAKVLAGGYPGGALTGKAEIFECMEHTGQNGQIIGPPLGHQGTFNGNPISAAAGIATLKIIKSTPIIDCANRAATALRDGMNEVLKKRGSHWSVYGDFSGFHVFTNPSRENVGPADIQAGRVPWQTLKSATPAALMHNIRAAFLCAGVDVCTWPGGWVSGVHTPEDIGRSVEAFEQVLNLLEENGA